jgi:hypothetical protein
MAAIARVTAGIACAVAILSASVLAAERTTTPIAIAVAEFDYTDTSGEARDQQAEHAARLRALGSAIRADLAEAGKFRVVALACSAASCSAGRSNPAELIADARRAGATLLLYGGIQKVSTLIQQGRVQVVNVDTNSLVFDRLISFRGDTDDAWQHAERFLVRQLASEDFAR